MVLPARLGMVAEDATLREHTEHSPKCYAYVPLFLYMWWTHLAFSWPWPTPMPHCFFLAEALACSHFLPRDTFYIFLAMALSDLRFPGEFFRALHVLLGFCRITSPPLVWRRRGRLLLHPGRWIGRFSVLHPDELLLLLIVHGSGCFPVSLDKSCLLI